MNASIFQTGTLLGQSFLGNQFYQDTNPAWVRIDGLILGYKHRISIDKTKDIGELLDNHTEHSNVTVVSYNWDTRRVIVGGSFDLRNESDTVQNHSFSTFIVKSKAVYEIETPIPHLKPSISLVFIFLFFNS